MAKSNRRAWRSAILLPKQRIAWAAAAAAALSIAGCPAPPKDDGAGASTIDAGSNDSFATATQTIVTNDAATIEGSVDAVGEHDLYRVASLNLGDRIVVDVDGGTELDLVAALFSDDEDVVAFNDDRVMDGSDLNPLIDIVVRGAAGDYILGIAPYPSSTATGDYTVHVAITRDAGVPDQVGQMVFLEWRGGEGVVVPNVGSFDLPPFDATQLGPYSSGQTANLKLGIEQVIADRFKAYNFTLLNSDDTPDPPDPHSTIYFGSRSRVAFAVSEQIDTFNQDQADDAIVFTESFDGAFNSVPTLAEMAVAVGNTTAHEIGHLLGLVHTRECSELMDSTCSNDALLFEQTFGKAPLDSNVFPVGFQDAAEILGWVLGLAP